MPLLNQDNSIPRETVSEMVRGKTELFKGRTCSITAKTLAEVYSFTILQLKSAAAISQRRCSPKISLKFLKKEVTCPSTNSQSLSVSDHDTLAGNVLR